MVARVRSEKAKLPAAVKAVIGGTNCTNAEWSPWLTKPNRRIWPEGRDGRHPRTISPEILAAAGHPPRSATTVIKAYLVDVSVDRDPERDKGLARVRELCIECSAGSTSEVARCPIIHCALWAHRMGKNPHTRR